MGFRVTEDDVQKILGSESGVDLQLFIDVASRWVDDVLSGSSLTADRLGDIELYLAAHLGALTEEGGGVTLQRTGQSSVQYAQLGEGLESTRFGRVALTLDKTGKLTSSVKEKATFQAIGPKVS